MGPQNIGGGDMDRRSYMKGMGAALASYAVASAAKGQPVMESSREHLTKAQFDQIFKQLSNWGRWGKDDQLGTLNLITPARRREAAALVREGKGLRLGRGAPAARDAGWPLERFPIALI